MDRMERPSAGVLASPVTQISNTLSSMAFKPCQFRLDPSDFPPSKQSIDAFISKRPLAEINMNTFSTLAQSETDGKRRRTMSVAAPPLMCEEQAARQLLLEVFTSDDVLESIPPGPSSAPASSSSFAVDHQPQSPHRFEDCDTSFVGSLESLRLQPSSPFQITLQLSSLVNSQPASVEQSPPTRRVSLNRSGHGDKIFFTSPSGSTRMQRSYSYPPDLKDTDEIGFESSLVSCKSDRTPAVGRTPAPTTKLSFDVSPLDSETTTQLDSSLTIPVLASSLSPVQPPRFSLSRDSPLKNLPCQPKLALTPELPKSRGRMSFRNIETLSIPFEQPTVARSHDAFSCMSQPAPEQDDDYLVPPFVVNHNFDKELRQQEPAAGSL
jgi:hypothetical protein